jgi:hypothetical protein
MLFWANLPDAECTDGPCVGATIILQGSYNELSTIHWLGGKHILTECGGLR